MAAGTIMTAINEHSAGVVPYRIGAEGTPEYLVLHSALVRNPRAKWEFPKGAMEPGETSKQTAAREFEEETGIRDYSFVEGFEKSLTYTYVRKNVKVVKTVVYYVAHVNNDSLIARSNEHVEDGDGLWYQWGTFERIRKLLYHAKIRNLFGEADQWIRGRSACETHEKGVV